MSPVAESPEADTSAPPPPPIVLHFRKSCSGGPLIDTTQFPDTIDDTTPSTVAKKLVNELLNASHKPEKILARLGALHGDEMVITHGGNTFTIKLPQLRKASDLENLFPILSAAIGCCQNLFCLDMIGKDCQICDLKSPSPTKRKLPEQEAATSTTPADTSNLSESPVSSLNKVPTQEWGIEEVIQFIESTDPCLGVHADLFRKHVSITFSK